MHARILRWLHARPLAIAMVFLLFAGETCFLAAWWMGPQVEAVFNGPDPTVCSRAQQTHNRRDVTDCCAAASVYPRPVCEGTPAERRRQAERARAAARLDQSRARWEDQRPQHYRFTYRFSCFICPGIAGPTFTSEVRQGQVVLAGSGVGEPPDLEWAGRYATMELIFAAVEATRAGSPYHAVEYSRQWGYPRRLSWGTLYVTDSVTSLEVLDFEALP